MMEFLQLPYDILVLYALPFLVALSFIVFIHEFGHYYVARLCGVKIDAFSIGFGPEIMGRNDKHGTRWKWSAIPLGGYVKFAGDANAASLPDAGSAAVPNSLQSKSVWQRAAIVAAGPIANFILAAVIFAVPVALWGERVVDPVVAVVQQDSVAEKAGLRPGDWIMAINGKDIKTFDAISRIVLESNGDELRLHIRRDGKEFDVTARPKRVVDSDMVGGKANFFRLGIGSSTLEQDNRLEPRSIPQSVAIGVSRTADVVTTTLKFIGRLFTGKESVDQVRGPTGMGQAAGKVLSDYGILAFFSFIGLISASIGLVNLFPIPMLDGGHLVYYAIEALRGRPLGQNAQEWGYRVGISVVLTFLVVATWNDFVRIFVGS